MKEKFLATAVLLLALLLAGALLSAGCVRPANGPPVTPSPFQPGAVETVIPFEFTGGRAEIAPGSTPVEIDTDGDGLADASEARLRTDRWNPDTDGDGILDGNETYTSVVRYGEEDILVAITGKGDLAKDLWISSGGDVRLEQSPARIGPLVYLELRSPFDEAALTFPYHATKGTDPRDVALYRAKGNLLSEIPSTIDSQDHRITGKVSQFGTFGWGDYTVMDRTLLIAYFGKICVGQGYHYRMTKDPTARDTGVCLLGDGLDCDMDAFNEGRCPEPLPPVQVPSDPGLAWCSEQGFRNEIRRFGNGTAYTVCIFTDDSWCETDSYWMGVCDETSGNRPA